MALTRPKIWDIDTSIEYFMDPITTLHQGSTQANVDVGFIFNRANGLVSNVALYWNETKQSFTTAYTTSTGVTDSNIAVTSYANITVGNVFATGLFWAGNGAVIQTGGGGSSTITVSQLTNGVQSNTITGVSTINFDTTTGFKVQDLGGGNVFVYQGSGYKYIQVAGQSNIVATGEDTLTFVAGNNVSLTTNATSKALTINANIPGVIGFSTNNSVVATYATPSTSTSTGALQVVGGLGIKGNVFAGNVYTSGLFWSGNGQVIQTGGGGGGGGIAYTASATAPASGTNGDQWYNTTTDTLYEYVNNGVDSFWLDVQTPIISSNATPTLSGNVSLAGNLLVSTGDIVENYSVTLPLSSYVYYFDGSSGLRLPTTTNLNFFSNDFTIEFWMFANSTQQTYATIADASMNDTATSIGVENNLGGTPGTITFQAGSSFSPLFGSINVLDSTWHHIACVRSGSNGYIFVDGALDTSTSAWSGNSSGYLSGGEIGRSSFFTGDFSDRTFTGYLSNFRVVNGTAVYTSAFTVPNPYLDPIHDTQLLTLRDSTIVDVSPNNMSFSVVGDSPVVGTSPTLAISGGGSSIQYNNHLNLADTSGNVVLLTRGSPALTIDAWQNVYAATPSSIDNSTKVATTAFVQNALASISGGGGASLPSNPGYSGLFALVNDGFGSLIWQQAIEAWSSPSYGAAGYQKLPSGLILQWGSASGYGVVGSGYPLVFPNGVMTVFVTLDTSVYGSPPTATASISYADSSFFSATITDAYTGIAAFGGVNYFVIGA